MKKILPSILSADFANLQRDMEELESIGIDMFHVDVMDGNFVPNISLGFPVIKSIREKIKSTFDCHLMIDQPEKYVEEFCKVGCDMISFHVESTKHADRVVQIIQKNGKKAGVVLNPHTPISMVKHLLNKVDYVLIMTVNPGFGGQKFIPEMLEKLEELVAYRKEKNYDFLIEVDGGINIETSKLCRDLGADMLVCGSFLFGAEDKKATYEALLK